VEFGFEDEVPLQAKLAGIKERAIAAVVVLPINLRREMPFFEFKVFIFKFRLFSPKLKRITD
jgi:hypothetical protein